jgi:hypothetical protein
VVDVTLLVIILHHCLISTVPFNYQRLSEGKATKKKNNMMNMTMVIDDYSHPLASSPM